jgi:hypothetical protein
MDGTLVRSDETVSDYSLRVLRKLRGLVWQSSV